ncbi:MAG TPA: LemA family protein [Xanthobacteraceae bacterium]|nr:LemA family protein [Xanthobacteraceae bacterium]
MPAWTEFSADVETGSRQEDAADIDSRPGGAVGFRFPLLAVLIGLLLSGCGINNIPTYQEAAKAKWSDVQNQYQRRSDLIPNLVETVKGYAKQEREVLEAVTEARARATSVQVTPDLVTNPEAFKKFEDAQAQLSGALGRLLAVSEKYPELKSNQNFLALQAQLEGTENRIAVARHDYIEAVRVYNTELKTFPGKIWAATLYRSDKPMETFTVAEDVKKTPEVKF